MNARLNKLHAKFEEVVKKVDNRHSSVVDDIRQGTNLLFTRKDVELALPLKFKVP